MDKDTDFLSRKNEASLQVSGYLKKNSHLLGITTYCSEKS